EASLDRTSSRVLHSLQSDAVFTNQLLPLAQQLAKLNGNPWLKLAHTDVQGYAVVTVTPMALQCDFHEVNKLVGNAAPAEVVARTTVATVHRNRAEISIA